MPVHQPVAQPHESQQRHYPKEVSADDITGPVEAQVNARSAYDKNQEPHRNLHGTAEPNRLAHLPHHDYQKSAEDKKESAHWGN